MSRAGSTAFTRIGTLLRRPVVWLLLLLAVQGLALQRSGHLEPRRVADTPTYLTAAKIAGDLEAALSYRRTTGYGRFLRLFARDDWSFALAWVPPVQLVLFDASVLLLLVALGRFFASPWLAFAASAPMVGSPALTLVDRVQPDFLALAFVVAAFAFLALLVERGTPVRWLGLVGSVFASYQLRPAGFFVVALLPVLGVAWRVIRNRQRLVRALAFGAWVALATVGPYVAFATLRAVTVGHFGLVSFGGANAAGVAIYFIDEELAAELPADQAEMARKIIELRAKRGYRAMVEGDDPADFWGQYGDNIFRVGLSVAMWDRKAREARVERAGLDDPSLDVPRLVEANDRLAALASEVFRRRPRLYARWVRASLELSLRQLGLRWISVPFWLLVASLPLAWLAARRRGAPAAGRRDHGPADASAGRRAEPRVPAASRSTGEPPAGPRTALCRRALACFALGAISFYAAYTIGISLVSLPFERYFLSTIVFLPGLLVALLVELWTSALARHPG